MKTIVLLHSVYYIHITWYCIVTQEGQIICYLYAKPQFMSWRIYAFNEVNGWVLLNSIIECSILFYNVENEDFGDNISCIELWNIYKAVNSLSLTKADKNLERVKSPRKFTIKSISKVFSSSLINP